MKIEINNLTKEKIKTGFLKKIAEKAAKFIKIKIPEISVVLVGDARIKSLNKKYRQKNRITDVLAFDCGLQSGGQGEIIICLDQAKRQAKELKHSLKEELAILLVHGLLHLAGYDDEMKKQRDEMIKKQSEILLKLKNSPR